MEGDPIFNQVSSELKDLIKSMLEVIPDERITLEEAMSHPWFNLQCGQEKVQSEKQINFKDFV
jgi:serine/threonine protein kinase